MSILLIALPCGSPGEYPYAISRDGRAVHMHGLAAPALLPIAGRGVEVIAIVPARMLSWHEVTLPKGIGPDSARLGAVLSGLLEERLLDDPSQLHFALAPNAQAGEKTLVAVCDKSWLVTHLKTLEEAGRVVGKIVPQAQPSFGEQPRVLFAGENDHFEMIVTGGPQTCVQTIPLTQTLVGTSLTQFITSVFGSEKQDLQLLTLPQCAQLAESLMGRSVNLITAHEHWLQLSHSRWDLAQMDLAQSSRARAARHLSAWFRELIHAHNWRPVRWAVALLVVINLIGINALAWNQSKNIKTIRTEIASVLSSSFPQVKVVIDAPAQMQQQLLLLRHATGSPISSDLEPMLSAWATVSNNSIPSEIDFTPGQLRLKDVKMTAQELTLANERLHPQGYELKNSGLTVTLSALKESY